MSAFAFGILAGSRLCSISKMAMSTMLLLTILLIAIITVSFFIFRKKMIVALLVIAVFGAGYYCLSDSVKDPLENIEGEVTIIKGRILSIQEKKSGWQLEVMRMGARKGGSVLVILPSLSKCGMSYGVTAEKPESFVGKDVAIKGRVELPTGALNPGGFDYRMYLKTRGIRVILAAYDSHLQVTGKGNQLFSLTADIRGRLGEALELYMDDNAKGMLIGMLFGDKTYLSDDVYEIFRQNGTAHILAVSGIHVGIVYLLIHRILGKRKSVLKSSVTLGGLLFYAALASFSPSVVRAVIMIAVHIISKHLHKRYDFLCGASFSALIMLLCNPYRLFNVGFQLSFLAVIALAFLLPPIEKYIRQKTDQSKTNPIFWLGKIFAPVAVIQIGLWPAIAYLFNYFSLSAFIVNIPTIAIAGIIIPLGIAAAVLVCILSMPAATFIFAALVTAINILMKIMFAFNNVLYIPGITSFNMVSPSLVFICIYYGILLFLASEGFWLLFHTNNIRVIAIAICMLAALSLAIPLIAKDYKGKVDLTFVSVGQGDCLHIRTPKGKNILIDGGGSIDYDVGRKILMPYLLKNGAAKIDLALVTHLHADHFYGIAELCQEGMIKRMGMYEGTIMREDEWKEQTGFRKENVLALVKGKRINIEKDIWIDIIYPEGKNKKEYEETSLEKEDENESSLLIKVSYLGKTIMMTGDLGIEGEMSIMGRRKKRSGYEDSAGTQLRCDILKVGHHGSRRSTSDEFLDAVDPKVAIIQVGRNNHFGHPHPEVIEKLKNRNIMIYRTDLQGAILVKIQKGKMKIYGMES